MYRSTDGRCGCICRSAGVRRGSTARARGVFAANRAAGAGGSESREPGAAGSERQLLQAAVVDGILKTAQQNARTTLTSLLQGLGFGSVEFY